MQSDLIRVASNVASQVDANVQNTRNLQSYQAMDGKTLSRRMAAQMKFEMVIASPSTPKTQGDTSLHPTVKMWMDDWQKQPCR